MPGEHVELLLAKDRERSVPPVEILFFGSGTKSPGCINRQGQEKIFAARKLGFLVEQPAEAAFLRTPSKNIC